MTSNSDGMGGGSAPDPMQTTAAKRNASQPFGNGKLLGAASGRDVSPPPPAEGRAPAAAPRPRWQPPAQPAGNAKSLPPSRFAVHRTAVKPK